MQGQAEQTRASKLPTFEEEMNGTYKKIHKVLGEDHRNKDLREEVKGKLNEKPEN